MKTSFYIFIVICYMFFSFTMALSFRVVANGSWWVAPFHELHYSGMILWTQ